jgi:uncharacterized protein YbjT (DUF2867 family)
VARVAAHRQELPAVKVILFGASGMVGQGTLRECLLDPDVERVLVIGRTSIGRTHAKLTERLVTDLFDLSALTPELSGWDACFFSLGVSAAGMTEAGYRRLTYDLTLSVATLLAKQNPNMTFVYVSGAGTDSTEKGKMMWARVKGATENALLKLPFRGAYMFRPGLIRPVHGERSKTRAYRIGYYLLAPIIPILTWLFPRAITTTERVGRAMLAVAKHGAPHPFIEQADINRIGAAAQIAPAPQAP